MPVQGFAPDEFKPPADAQVSGYCSDSELTGTMHPSAGNAIPVGFTDSEFDMYFEITPEGGVRYADMVYSSQPGNNKEVLNWFVGTHFPIRTCAGKPVAYETMVRLVAGH